MTTCNLCGDMLPAEEIVDHIRVMHPDHYEVPVEGFTDVDDDQGMETARVTIVRRLTDDDVIDYVEAVDGSGDDLPLTEALGMMRLAEDTLIRERMGVDE